MKKIAFVFAAVVAVSFASCCGNKCAKSEECADSCQAEPCDSSCVCDSAACDSTCNTAACVCAE